MENSIDGHLNPEFCLVGNTGIFPIKFVFLIQTELLFILYSSAKIR